MLNSVDKFCAGEANALGTPRARDTTHSASIEARLHRRALSERRKARLVDSTVVAVGRAVLIAVVLGLWALASGRWLDAETVSNPQAVLTSLGDLIATGRIWPELGQTVAEVIVGYFAGAICGAALALAFAATPGAEQVLRPFLLSVYSIPKVALAPLIVMWFGLGIAPKMILSGMFVFFIVFMNAVAGVQSVNSKLVTIMRVMGAGRLTLMRKLIVPTMLPFLLLGLRISIPEAMTGAVIGEFISSNHGLGNLIYSASNEMNTAVSLAALLVLVVVVALADIALGLIERLLPWRPMASQMVRASAGQR
jgi:NitT/TauT family transport system permease protein